MAIDPTIVALVGTVMGGVGLKLAEHWLGRKKVKVDDAARIRDELRTELTAVRADNNALEIEVDKWKTDYYKTWEQNVVLKALLRANNINLPPPE